MTDRDARMIEAEREHGRSLLRFIRGRVRSDADAEDVLQDVWTQLAAQPEIEAIEQIGAWLHRVARNRITDRSRKKRPVALDDLAAVDADGELRLPDIMLRRDKNDDPDILMLRDLFWEELFTALDAMPEAQRSVFVANELEGRTLQAIADDRGEPLKTIISRKRYAVQRLRVHLNELHDELMGP
ncbi:MAG: sigma-70 family RNA polymerase sigma factor [Flavobacteriales bacterium]|nr:sigma-70 family RNA polymerase sigma factor [Flavobacteriales bacterium]